jgi:hypothetical protein
MKTCDRALKLLPGDAGILAITATIHQARGELDEARAKLLMLAPSPGDWRSLRVLSRQSFSTTNRRMRWLCSAAISRMPARSERVAVSYGVGLQTRSDWLATP